MSELVLDEEQQRAMRALLTEEPVPGSPVPSREFLENVASLIPCDAIGACLAHNEGWILESRELPHAYADDFTSDQQHLTGPLYVGVMHWSRVPLQAEACQALLPGYVDGVSIGYRSGPDAVAQIFLDRQKHPFSDRDLALLDLLLPVFQRHLRQRATKPLPAALTVQERRVLLEVAAGLSNADIAAALFIAPSTVRKHLEHAFRKLGVTNRLATVIALEGRELLSEHADRREQIEGSA